MRLQKEAFIFFCKPMTWRQLKATKGGGISKMKEAVGFIMMKKKVCFFLKKKKKKRDRIIDVKCVNIKENLFRYSSYACVE